MQVCGCSPPQMARVAQLIEETVDCDFVDINMGCPIGKIFFFNITDYRTVLLLLAS